MSFLLMLAWNPKLILSTAVGAGLMLALYRLQDWDWSRVRREGERMLKSSNGKLILAVGGGGIGALTTYTAAEIWVSVENSWVALGTIIEGVATLGSFGLLGYYIWGREEETRGRELDRWLGDLTAGEPLKRLIAVRQLSAAIDRGSLPPTGELHVREFFRLMLTREKDPTVRAALSESLGISPAVEPLRIPIKQTAPGKKVYQ